MATSLRGRASSKHLDAGVSLFGSSLRLNKCGLLFGIPPNVTGRPTYPNVATEQVAENHDGLLAYGELSWQPCATVLDADQLERHLHGEFIPQLKGMASSVGA